MLRDRISEPALNHDYECFYHHTSFQVYFYLTRGNKDINRLSKESGPVSLVWIFFLREGPPEGELELELQKKDCREREREVCVCVCGGRGGGRR